MTRTAIGLGHRCDTAFQLRMHGRENVAHFFDWLSTPAEGLITILERDFDVFHPEDLQLRQDHFPHCVRDRLTGTWFHHQFPTFSGHVPPDFLMSYTAFIRKFQYLAQRFRDYLATRPVTLVRRGITQEQALRLEQAVANTFPSVDVRFLYLLDDGAEFTTPNGQARVIGYGDSSFGDPEVWLPILTAENLVAKPYLRATMDILGTAYDDHNLGYEGRFTGDQLRAAFAANPQNPAFLIERAHWHAAQAQWTECFEAAQQALTFTPPPWGAAFYAALSEWALGTLDVVAVGDRLREQALRPDAPVSWSITASEALREAGRIDEARACLTATIKVAPTDQRLYLEKAHCLRAPGEAEEMIRVLDVARQLCGGALPALHEHYLANALEELGAFDAALEAAQRSAAGPPNFSFLWSYAGLLKRQGDIEGALAALDQARTVASNDQQQSIEQWLLELTA